MAVTSFDVARAAGVSQPTVSRALRDDPGVASETRDRVRRVAVELGYVPSERGRSLSTRSTGRVAMVVDLDNPLWPLLVRRLHDALEAAGLRLTLLASRGRPVDLEGQLFGGGVDGVIMSTVTVDSPVPEQVRARGLPIVLLNRYVDDSPVAAAVADDHAGGMQAAELLVDAGHRDVGALFGPPTTSTGRGREEGFREGLEEAGIRLRDEWVWHGPFDYSHGRKGISHMVDLPERPTALFCANDVIALGAMDAARPLGMSVPGDLALVGFDDLDEASWTSFDLSTIAVPFDAMVDTAVRLLVAQIDGRGDAAGPIIHPVGAVERTSHLLRSGR